MSQQIPAQDKARLLKILNQSQEKAVQLRQQEQEAQAKKPKAWGSLTRHRQEELILKALESIMHSKEISPAVGQTLPPKLFSLLEEQRKHLQLGRKRELQPRLEMLVKRLRDKGLLDKPAQPDNPLNRLTPAQRRRQEAAEALELRRQNAIQMVEATKLLPKRSV